MTLIKDLKLGRHYSDMIPKIFDEILNDDKRILLASNKGIFTTFEGHFEGEYLKISKKYDQITLVVAYFFRLNREAAHVYFMDVYLSDIINHEFSPEGSKLIHHFFTDLYTELVTM